MAIKLNDKIRRYKDNKNIILSQREIRKVIMSHRLSKDSEDLKSQRSQSLHGGTNTEHEYAQSFQAGGASKKFINIQLPNIEIKGKEYYKKQPYCTICYRNFTTTFRQHHCRLCANAVCGQCSRSMINKERACDLCVLRYTNIHEQKKKKEMLETLQTLCAFLIYQKNQKIAELQRLKSATAEGGNMEQVQEELRNQNKTIDELQKDNENLKSQYKVLEEKLNGVRDKNSEIQNKISEIQQEMQNHPEQHDQHF